ncbi:MAG: hypothetical protein AB2L24_07530 [Mangrovibacterium sp.]
MTRNFLLILLNFLLVTGCSHASGEADPFIAVEPEKESVSSEVSPIRGACIFAGQAEVFTDADWQALAESQLTDFVIIPKEAGHYGATEAGYKAQLAPFMAGVIHQLVTRRSTARIWIGTPGISSLNYTISGSSLEPVYNYLDDVRNRVGAAVWANNIGGVYMNMESIYGTVAYHDPGANPCIKLMEDLSARVRQELKVKFLWIPYYGYGANADEITKRIGYVVNKQTIFDYVVVQPHYYFDGNVPENLKGVKYSTANQAISYRDGLAVTPKTSQTVIGPEIELSWKVVPPNNYPDFLSRYDEYLFHFSEFKDIYPIIFYWDGTLRNVLTDRINPFFQ